MADSNDKNTSWKRASRAALEADHTREAIKQRLREPTRHSYLRDFVYGAIDGTVTTFAVVCAAEGAGVKPTIVVIMGVANLLADGFSMAIGNFLGTRAERQMLEQQRRSEEEHIRLHPEGEREEVREIFRAKGFEGEVLERVVEVITAEKRRWVDTMLQEEHGLQLDGPNPVRAGLSTFAAFVLAGALPLVAYLLQLLTAAELGSAFWWSVAMTGVTFFLVGVGKSRFVQQSWWLAGLETLGIGGAAAVMAYGVGWALKGIGA